MISVSCFSLLGNRYRLSIRSSPYSLLRLLIHTHYYLLLSIIRIALNFIITVLSSTLFASASESQTPLSVVISRVQALTMPRQGTSRPDQIHDSSACSSCRALVDLGHIHSCQLIKNFIGPRLHRLPQRLDYTLIPAPLGAFFSLTALHESPPLMPITQIFPS